MLAEEYKLRVLSALKKADDGVSNIDKNDLTNPDYKTHYKGVYSMDQPHYFHVLNNLCSYEGVVHTHIGFFNGGSLFAAIEGNNPKKVFAIDSFFGGAGALKETFLENSTRLGYDGRYTLLAEDCFSMDLSLIDEPVNFHLYDNGHEYEEQYKGIVRFESTFADTVILMVDNFCDHVIEATDQAVHDLLDFDLYFRTVCEEHCHQGYYVLQRR